MRSSIVFLASLASVALAADGGGQVPGNSPLQYCSADHANDLITFTNVSLNPTTIESGGNLTIQAEGTVLQPIADGASVDVSVKLGIITLYSTTIKLCDQVGQVGLQCPLPVGPVTINKSVAIPGLVPSGQYDLLANATTVDGKDISCIQATVTIGS